MKIIQYDDDMRAEDFIHEERVRKINQFKEKKKAKLLQLDKLPKENDMEDK